MGAKRYMVANVNCMGLLPARFAFLLFQWMGDGSNHDSLLNNHMRPQIHLVVIQNNHIVFNEQWAITKNIDAKITRKMRPYFDVDDIRQ